MLTTTLCYIAIALWIVVSIGIFLIYLLIKGQKKRIKDENLNSVSTISPARLSESTSNETLYSFVEEANVIDTTSYRSVTTFNDTNRFQPYLGKFDILFSVYKCKYLKIFCKLSAWFRKLLLFKFQYHRSICTPFEFVRFKFWYRRGNWYGSTATLSRKINRSMFYQYL